MLSGCALVQTAQRTLLTVGPPVALLRTRSGAELVLAACDTFLSSTCERVEKTDDPTDEESWHFEVQIDVTGPFREKVGTAPMTVYVMGGKDKCEAVYAGWPHKNLPCEGPAYFRRG